MPLLNALMAGKYWILRRKPHFDFFKESNYSSFLLSEQSKMFPKERLYK